VPSLSANAGLQRRYEKSVDHLIGMGNREDLTDSELVESRERTTVDIENSAVGLRGYSGEGDNGLVLAYKEEARKKKQTGAHQSGKTKKESMLALNPISAQGGHLRSGGGNKTGEQEKTRLGLSQKRCILFANRWNPLG